MPGLDISQLGGLPAVDPALLPAEVRAGTPEDRQLYTAALAFERLLVEKITAELAEGSSVLGEDDEEGDSGSSSSMLGERLPGLLADSLAAGGGLGVAAELYRAVKATDPTAPSGPTEVRA